MKILFLDFDGVIATNRAWLANGAIGGFVSRDDQWIDPIAVAMIADLCTKFGYQIVVTSTWRKFGKAVCTSALGRANIWMHDDWCTKDLWATGDSKGSRPTEIDDWLARNSCDDYLIIDDDWFDWTADQLGRWVKTDTCNGFSTENYEEVVNRNEGHYSR